MRYVSVVAVAIGAAQVALRRFGDLVDTARDLLEPSPFPTSARAVLRYAVSAVVFLGHGRTDVATLPVDLAQDVHELLTLLDRVLHRDMGVAAGRAPVFWHARLVAAR